MQNVTSQCGWAVSLADFPSALPRHWARRAPAWHRRRGWRLAYSVGLSGAPRRRQESLRDKREGTSNSQKATSSQLELQEQCVRSLGCACSGKGHPWLSPGGTELGVWSCPGPGTSSAFTPVPAAGCSLGQRWSLGYTLPSA